MMKDKVLIDEVPIHNISQWANFEHPTCPPEFEPAAGVMLEAIQLARVEYRYQRARPWHFVAALHQLGYDIVRRD